MTEAKKSWQKVLREMVTNTNRKTLEDRAKEMVGRSVPVIVLNPFDRSGVNPGGINHVPEEEEES